MNGEKKILVRRSADNVGNKKEFDRQNRTVTEPRGTSHLERYNDQYKVLGQWLMSTKSCYLKYLDQRLSSWVMLWIRQWHYLRMGFDDGLPSRSMGFLGVGPKEVVGSRLRLPWLGCRLRTVAMSTRWLFGGDGNGGRHF